MGDFLLVLNFLLREEVELSGCENGLQNQADLVSVYFLPLESFVTLVS